MGTSNRIEIDNYALYGLIGRAFSGQAAVCMCKKIVDKEKPSQIYAMRVYPLDCDQVALEGIETEIGVLKQLNNPNILPVLYCTVNGPNLCVVTPLFDYGSVSDVLHSQFQNGLPERAIAFILHEVLIGLTYLHKQNILHRGIRSSHILLSSSGGRVCLSGFRYYTVVDTSDGIIRRFSSRLANNLLWLAPEILKQDLNGYGLKADMYSVGISACEMANGFPPFADMESLQMLFEKDRGTTPKLLDATTLPDDSDHAEQRTRQFSADFHNFTDACLNANPQLRLDSFSALTHPFFKQLKKSSSNLKQLLGGLNPFTISSVGPVTREELIPIECDRKKASWDF